jgi:hypothetical protein
VFDLSTCQPAGDLHDAMDSSVGVMDDLIWAAKMRCFTCVRERLVQCHAEHPAWFTPKRQLVKSSCYQKVLGYLTATPAVPCVMFRSSVVYEDADDDMGCDMEVRGLCETHLKKRLTELFPSILSQSGVPGGDCAAGA